MTELETAMVMVMDVFDKYACKEGKKGTLTKGEMKCLLEKELPGSLGNAKEKDTCGEILKDLDVNNDSVVDFNEFIILIAAMVTLGHERFEKTAPKK